MRVAPYAGRRIPANAVMRLTTRSLFGPDIWFVRNALGASKRCWEFAKAAANFKRK
jgi:hypothetical protein